jgi:hypothetical protein
LQEGLSSVQERNVPPVQEKKISLQAKRGRFLLSLREEGFPTAKASVQSKRGRVQEKKGFPSVQVRKVSL